MEVLSLAGGGDVAACDLARLGLDELGRLATADVDREWAAVDEPAAGRRVDGGGRRALADLDRLEVAHAGSGTDAISSRVYGCSGFASTSSIGPCSTIWPAYMTRMSSAT